MAEKVVVIGGGIIGLSCAYYLSKNNFDVTILDKEDFANACSKGNQGWVCPAMHAPIPEPGLVRTSMKWLMKKDSPLYIKPSAVIQLSGWLNQFMKHCNEKDYEKAEFELLNLSRSTLSLFDSLESEGLNFEMHRKGMLLVFFNEFEMHKNLKKFEKGAKIHGHEIPVILSGDEVRELEPSLSNDVVGALLLKSQRHVRPESLAKAFIEKLIMAGADLLSNHEVTEVEYEGDKVVAVKTATGRFEADRFLFATGGWSSYLAKELGYHLPIQAGKGYSITISNPNLKFNHPMYLGDSNSRVAVSPFDGALRIGGTMELSGINTDLDKKRVQGIRDSISKSLNKQLQGESEIEWTGMRPMTPDGLPVLGKVPGYHNAFIATGHGMIGIAMAPVTGMIMSDLIRDGKTEFKIDAFDPARYQKVKA